MTDNKISQTEISKAVQIETKSESQKENIVTDKINESKNEISNPKQNENSNNNSKDSIISNNNQAKTEVKEKKEVKKRISKSHANLKRTSVSTIQPLVIRKGATSNYLKGNTSYMNEGNDVSLDVMII